jgi:type VI secretion system protein ImpG
VAGIREDLLNYYERELTYIRQMGVEWAKKYPKLAGRLLLEPDRCEDPHVERLLEGFALLAARVHLKIDDDFPEISSALLECLFPHLIRPVPSMTVVELQLDPEQGKLSTGLHIPEQSLLQSNRLNGTACKFRTAYDTTIWPLQVKAATFRSSDGLFQPSGIGTATAALTLQIECLPDVVVRALELDKLRFYLAGDNNVANGLYELLFNNCIAITARDTEAPGAKPIVLFDSSLGSPSPLRQVGFAENEGVLPYSGRSFLGFRLLQEYFTFPEKFFFADLTNLEMLRDAGFGSKCEITFLFSRFERPERHQMLELGVSQETVKLGCVPAINLFPQTAEPIRADGSKFEYPIVPDLHRQSTTEIYSIEDVTAQDTRTRSLVRYHPFYALRYDRAAREKTTFWHAVRRASELYDDVPTGVFLALVDRSGIPVQPDSSAITVKCTCTNGNLPSKLPIAMQSESQRDRSDGDFRLEGFPAVKKVFALRRPTVTYRPPLGKASLWQLISHLSLNYLSLVEQGKDALQELLRLYNFSDSIHLRNQINSITGISSRRHYALVTSADGTANFARGTRVEIDFDEEQFAGGGVFLFCNVLERFFAHYVSLNSFSQLTASTRQRKEVIREWQPRSGNLILM